MWPLRLESNLPTIGSTYKQLLYLYTLLKSVYMTHILSRVSILLLLFYSETLVLSLCLYYTYYAL